MRALLDHEDTQAVFDDVERQLFNEWRHTQNEHERESLHATQRALWRVHALMQRWADELALNNIE